MMKTLSKDGNPYAFRCPAEGIDAGCPGCSYPMVIWNDPRDVTIKTAHCVRCDLTFQLEEVTE